MANKKSKIYSLMTVRSLRLEQLEARQMLAGDTCAMQEAAGLDIAPAVSSLASSASENGRITVQQDTSALARVVSLPTELTENVTVVVNVRGEELTLDLTQYSIRSANFRVVSQQADGSFVGIDPGADRTYQGSIVELPDVYVRALFVEDGITIGAYDQVSGDLLWGIRPSEIGAGHVLVTPESLQAEQEAQNALLHDHDGDGIPDHTAGQHDQWLASGDHDPGCTCPACCGQLESAEAPRVEALELEDYVADTPITEEPAPAFDGEFAAAQADAVLLNPVSVQQAEIAFDVSYRALRNRYGLPANPNQNQITAAQDAALDQINALLSTTIEQRLGLAWLRDALVEHVVGNVVFRSSPGPYVPIEDAIFAERNDGDNDVPNTPGTNSDVLNEFRRIWQTGVHGTSHDLAHLILGSGGGGLAFVGQIGTASRYSQADGGDPNRWLSFARHEVGHNWGLVHDHGGVPFFSQGPDGEATGVQYGVMWSGNQGTLTPLEQLRVVQERNENDAILDDIGSFTRHNVRPYAALDTFTVTGSGTFALDVLDNDFDANNDPLFISGAGDRFSQTFTYASGSVVSIGHGLGDRGQDVLLYTPAPGLTEEVIFYRNNDGINDNFGQVNITIDNPEVLIDVNDTLFIHDLGPASNPVLFPGSTLISPATIGDVFWSNPVDAIDRGSFGNQNQFNRDFVTGTAPTTLNHQLGPGQWRVTFNVGDPQEPVDNIQVAAEGQVFFTGLGNALAQPGQTRSFEVFVTDGELNLEFSDADTSDPRWAVARVVLDRTQAIGDFDNSNFVTNDDLVQWQGDFGQNGSSDADGDGDSDGNDFLAWQRNRQEVATFALIDETTGNGGLLTTTTETSDGQASTNSSGGLITNNNGRALVSSGSSNTYIDIPGWRAQRVALNGGNPAFGFDGVPNLVVGNEPAQYAFVNAGSMTLTSDPISGSFVAGSTFDLSFLAETTSSTGVVTATLTFDNGQSHTFNGIGAGTTAVTFDDSFELQSGANSVTVSLLLEVGNGGAPQLKVDSIALDVTTVAPPPASLTTNSIEIAAPEASANPVTAAEPQTLANAPVTAVASPASQTTLPSGLQQLTLATPDNVDETIVEQEVDYDSTLAATAQFTADDLQLLAKDYVASTELADRNSDNPEEITTDEDNAFDNAFESI